jgi:hypothetical protein
MRKRANLDPTSIKLFKEVECTTLFLWLMLRWTTCEGGPPWTSDILNMIFSNFLSPILRSLVGKYTPNSSNTFYGYSTLLPKGNSVVYSPIP